MPIGLNKETIKEKRDAILAALTAAFAAAGPYTEHQVLDELRQLDQHSDAELNQGVLMALVESEGQYSTKLGMEGKDGTLGLVIIFHCRVGEDDSPSIIENKEITLAQEIKAFCRAGVAGMSLQPQEFRFSLQRNHPYGYVAGKINVVSPRNSQA